MKAISLTGRLSLLLAVIGGIWIFSSFTPTRGGEGFEIFLDGKQIVRQFGNEGQKVQQVNLSSWPRGKELKIKYYHCGQPTQERQIRLRTRQNETLRTWRFANEKQAGSPMSIGIAELQTFRTSRGGNSWILSYQSINEAVDQLKLPRD